MTPGEWAARAWSERARVELHAERRFARLSARVARLDPGSSVARLLAEASHEEATHARLCDELAVSLGAAPVGAVAETPEIAPRGLDEKQALLYELVAACCVAETESMATLTLLLSKMEPGRFREVVHRIARDEVEHAQAGWAHLARAAARGETAFLGQHLVPMLDQPEVHRLFSPCDSPAGEAEALYAFGVVPHTVKRRVLTQVVDELITPGLRQNGVDPTRLAEWLRRLDFST